MELCSSPYLAVEGLVVPPSKLLICGCLEANSQEHKTMAPVWRHALGTLSVYQCSLAPSQLTFVVILTRFLFRLIIKRLSQTSKLYIIYVILPHQIKITQIQIQPGSHTGTYLNQVRTIPYVRIRSGASVIVILLSAPLLLKNAISKWPRYNIHFWYLYRYINV